MSTAFVGEIRCFGFNFAPRGWALCNGQLLSIQQNTALFSLLGTVYGGNGVSTFGLPNLQGQVPMHWGNGPGGFNTDIGQVQGSTAVTLISSQMPVHSHMIRAVAIATGGQSERTAIPSAATYLGPSANPNAAYQNPAPTINAPFSPKAISPTGNSLPHENMQPYLALNFCISLSGSFPSRN
ncbi:MAG TPA: tail fiber protein [Stellaceae bacterium]|jgi:microcystin-dependent protein